MNYKVKLILYFLSFIVIKVTDPIWIIQRNQKYEIKQDFQSKTFSEKKLWFCNDIQLWREGSKKSSRRVWYFKSKILKISPFWYFTNSKSTHSLRRFSKLKSKLTNLLHQQVLVPFSRIQSFVDSFRTTFCIYFIRIYNKLDS